MPTPQIDTPKRPNTPAQQPTPLPSCIPHPLMWFNNPDRTKISMVTFDTGELPLPERVIGWRDPNRHDVSIATVLPLEITFVADVTAAASHAAGKGIRQWELTCSRIHTDPAQWVGAPPDGMCAAWRTAATEYTPPNPQGRRGTVYNMTDTEPETEST